MKRISRGTRNLFFFIYALLAVFTVSLCLIFFAVFLRNYPSTQRADVYDSYYVLINDDSDSDLWNGLCSGAYEYGIENNVCVRDLSLDFSEKLTKEQLMRIAIASRVDGIIVNANESEEMIELIKEAKKIGIPVITAYNDCVNSDRISFVDIGNYNIGKEFSRKIISEINSDENLLEKDSIKVSILMDSVPSSGQSRIYSGIQDHIAKYNEDGRIELIRESINGANAFSVEESIREVFISQDVPDFVVCLSELDTTCAYQAVVDYNKVGEIHILGYYDSASILQGIERGIIDSTIKIDAPQMGEYCVKALLEYKKTGTASQYFTANAEVIDKANVSLYLEAEDEN